MFNHFLNSQFMAIFVVLVDIFSVLGFALLAFAKFSSKNFNNQTIFLTWWCIVISVTLLFSILLIGYVLHKNAQPYQAAQGFVIYGLMLTATPSLLFGFLSLFLKP
jgi:hypothetical protein